MAGGGRWARALQDSGDPARPNWTAHVEQSGGLLQPCVMAAAAPLAWPSLAADLVPSLTGVTVAPLLTVPSLTGVTVAPLLLVVPMLTVALRPLI